MARGRPSKWTDEVADEICRRLAEGAGLEEICADEHLPDSAQVYRRLHVDADFCEKYARARESQAEHHLDEIIAIADNATDDVMFLAMDGQPDGDGGKPAINHSAIARARLQIDARKWVMSKLAPKKYGDKQILAGDADNPLKLDTKIEIVHVKP